MKPRKILMFDRHGDVVEVEVNTDSIVDRRGPRSAGPIRQQTVREILDGRRSR